MRMHWLCLGVLAVAAAAPAQQTYVLAVGVSKYDDTTIADVPGANVDVTRILSVFKDKGVPEDNLHRLSTDTGDSSETPTYEHLRAALSGILKRVEPEDTLIFSFAGHGLYDQRTQDTYLFLSDTPAPANDPLYADRAFSLNKLEVLVKQSNCRQFLLLMDACRTELPADRGLRPRILTAEELGSYRSLGAVMTACQPGQAAYGLGDGKGGVFTDFLVSSIDDLAKAGEVKLQELYRTVAERMKGWSSTTPQEPGLYPETVQLVVLPVLTGQVVIESPTAGAMIVMNGRVVGESGRPFSLAPGEQRLVVRRDGYEDRPITVTIEENKLKRYRAALTPARLKVRLVSEPAGAELAIDDEAVTEKAPTEVMFEANRVYKVTARLAGDFLPAEQLLSFDQQPAEPVVLRLQPVRAAVRIDSDPPGAVVYRGNERLGVAGELLNLPPGNHRLAVRLGGYEDALAELATDADGLTVHSVKLRPAALMATVRTEPPGARLSINGVDTGQKTPCEVAIRPGEVVVRLELEGHLPLDQAIGVLPGQTPALPLWHLAPLPPGRLVLTTDPPGARILVDEAERGQSPLELPLPPGPHRITASMPGHHPATAAVEIAWGNHHSARLVLTPLPATLELRSDPPGARLTINGRPWESPTPCAVTVPAGEVTIRAELAGREPLDVRITARPGERGEVPLLRLPLPAPGRVPVRSEPAEAAVFIGNKQVATTPGEIALPPGTHRLRFERPGYAAVEVPVTVKAKATVPAVNVTLQPLSVWITVSTKPAGARLWVNGTEAPGLTPCRVELIPGNPVTLRAQHSDRPAAEQVITARAGAALELPLWRLPEALPGQVLVKSSVPATVACGAEALGSTPLLVERAAGRYRLTLAAAGYRPAEVEVELTSGKQAADALVQLLPLPSRLAVQSDPTGTAILVDGRPTGQQTPAEVEVAAGQLVVELRHEGYLNAQRAVVVKPGETLDVGLITMSREQGQLRVESEPGGAVVSVDGRDLGRAPQILPLAVGEHRIALRLDGYGQEERTVTVAAGQTTALMWRPAPLPATLTVTSRPSGAALSVDGQDIGGSTPVVGLALPAGRHRLALRLPGHRSFETEVELRPGGKLELPRVDLASEALPRDWPSWLQGFQPPAGMTSAEYRVVGPDRMPQVRMPAGNFTLGQRDGREDESPETVALGGYWIDLHEVTVGQYLEFCLAVGRRMPSQPKSSGPQHPVVNVSWSDAAAYAAWAGRRLPSEAQWEYAAQAGQPELKFPWGEGDGRPFAAFSSSGAAAELRPVASFAPNARGIFDLAGNANEWCLDFYAADFYQYAKKKLRNPGSAEPINDGYGGTEKGRMIRNPPLPPVKLPDRVLPATRRVLRGGSYHSPIEDLRCARRFADLPTGWSATYGFRCVSPGP